MSSTGIKSPLMELPFNVTSEEVEAGIVSDEVLRSNGVLPSQAIRRLKESRHIVAVPPIEEQHIQPASLDLRLGDVAYRVRASFLPGENSTVEAKMKDLFMSRLDLTGFATLERDCVYIVPLLE